MLGAQILKNRRGAGLTTALLGALCLAFASCASEPPKTALVSDPDEQKESSIPWNKPQTWEGRANFPGGMGGVSGQPLSGPGY